MLLKCNQLVTGAERQLVHLAVMPLQGLQLKLLLLLLRFRLVQGDTPSTFSCHMVVNGRFLRSGLVYSGCLVFTLQ
jgi:hypothetical protein